MDPATVTEYDVIIVGTSLLHSILAAALARSGRKVLYVDDAQGYGAENATVSFAELSKAFFSTSDDHHEVVQAAANEENETRGPLLSRISASSLSAFQAIGPPEGTQPIVRVNDYNIDFTARLVYCRGACVDVLAESGVSRYLEFQTLDGTFYCPSQGKGNGTSAAGSLMPLLVPQSKSQVFASSTLSMVEKRQLMRFLQFCLDYRATTMSDDDKTDGDDAAGAAAVGVEWTNERLGAQNPGRSLTRPQNKGADSELQDKAFRSQNESLSVFLQREVRMSKQLCDIVLFAIAHQAYCAGTLLDLTVAEGMKRVGRYLGALGRFGSTPFLTAMYGTGEICQGFSRLCAVYGGTCALGVRPSAVHENGVAFSMQANSPDAEDKGATMFNSLPPFIRAKQACVVSGAYFRHGDSLFPGLASEVELRAICLMNGSVFDSNYNRTFFVVPPSTDHEAAVHGIQLDHRARVVANEQYLIHLTTRIATFSETDIQEQKARLNSLIEQLAARRGGAVSITWRMFFYRRLIVDKSEDDLSARASSREKSNPLLFITGDSRSPTTPSAGMDVDLDEIFLKAERIFRTICPEETFLPASEAELRARQEEQNEALMMMPDLQ